RGVPLVLQTPLDQQVTPVCGIPVEGGVKVERLPDPQPIRQFCALQLNTNPLRQLAPLVGRIVAEDANGPRVWPPQAGERLDDAGLTGAVRAHQAEDLALAHREGHAVDRDLAAVGLPQTLPLDDRHPTTPPRRTARRECLPPREPTARMARQSARPDRPRSYILDQPQRRAPCGPGLMPRFTERRA